MRLILLDLELPIRRNFFPLALNRPIWELRAGMATLAEKLVAASGCEDVACFVPPYMAEAYQERTSWPVNDLRVLEGDDLLLVDARMDPNGMPKLGQGGRSLIVDENRRLLWAPISEADAAALPSDRIDAFVNGAVDSFATCRGAAGPWQHTWDLMLANPEKITLHFRQAERHGVEGVLESTAVIRGDASLVYVAPESQVQALAVIDVTNGPVYIDEGAVVHPFTRIEGPAYIGPKTVLSGARIRAGTSIGPNCRIGGEVEQSIVLGHTNKNHDGFLGHAVVGQWVDLGALTTNSDLKNDYSEVSVVLDGQMRVGTGSRKVGAMIGDHVRTSIGTLLNAGAYVGPMSMVLATGRPLTKFIPAFSWLLDGRVSDLPARDRLYAAARTAMRRRGQEFTAAEQAMWNTVYDRTAPQRDVARQR